MSAVSESQPKSRRSMRVAVILASTGVALCFAAALGLVQEPLKAQSPAQPQAEQVALASIEHPAD